MLDSTLFVSETIHEREITLGDGTKSKLWFKEIPAADLRKLQTGSTKDAEYEAAVSKVICASLCLADGKPAITPEEATRLKHGVRIALAFAVGEVNGLGSVVGKVLPPETQGTGSGTP